MPSTMTTSNTTNSSKVQFAFSQNEYYDFPTQHSLNSNCWWADRELELHQKIDMIDAQQPDGHRRGLEQHFKGELANSLRRDIANIQYVPSVVSKYRMSKTLMGKALRRASSAVKKSTSSKDEQLQKYCTKSSRKNTMKALRLAEQDEQEACRVYEGDAEVQKLMDDSTSYANYMSCQSQSQQEQVEPESDDVDHRRRLGRRSSIMKTVSKFEVDGTDQTAYETDSEHESCCISSCELEDALQIPKPMVNLTPRNISC